MKGLTRTSISTHHHSALALAFQHTVELTIRGGGKPYSNLAPMPTNRMGPPPGASPPMRMTASWSGSNHPTAYKSVARRRAPKASSPRIPNTPTDRHRPPRSYAKPDRRHHRFACSGLKALRNTSAARRQAAKLGYRFGPLTPSARAANLIAERRDEERLSRSEQRTGNSIKKLLDRKGPIQVRIRFAPAASRSPVHSESGREKSRAFAGLCA